MKTTKYPKIFIAPRHRPTETDSGTETIDNSGRVTPIPPDIFSEEEMTEQQGEEETKHVKKLTKYINAIEHSRREETDVEDFPTSEESNGDDAEIPDFDLRKMLPDSMITSQDDYKDSSEENSSEENQKHGSTVSGVSDLELASDIEGGCISPVKKLVVAVTYANKTDVEDLESEPLPQIPACFEELEATEEEILCEGYSSDEVKNAGVEKLKVTVPRIVISGIDDGKTETLGRKKLKKQRRKQREMFKQDASDIEEVFLMPETTNKKKRKTKKKKTQTLPNTDEEETDLDFQLPATDTETFSLESDRSSDPESDPESLALDRETLISIQNRTQPNWESPEEIIHSKNYNELAEVHTDVENIDLPDAPPSFRQTRDSSFEKSGNRKRAGKEWSEKGQIEEYAYETKGIISSQVAEPEPRDEARPKSDRETKTQVDDKVNFTEIDDEEDAVDTGNDPIPEVTMPSYKKRVHSQRIPQQERPAVTPYEGSYDEKYSSDEENVEYDVYEPDDVTERSNSTVTFSEDIYDSDAIDEMIKSQIRKPSHEGPVRSEDLETIKPSKSILKDKSGNKKKTSIFVQETPEDAVLTVSPEEMAKTLEEKFDEGVQKITEAVTLGKDKRDEKGEKVLEDVTKPDKGEAEAVTKPLQSTISQQIDQITDSAATNKQGDEVFKIVTKPLKDLVELSNTDRISEQTISDEVLTGESKEHVELIIKDEPKDQPPDSTRLMEQTAIEQRPDEGGKKTQGEPFDKGSKTEETSSKTPTKEDATRTAKELIEDITKTVQDVLPDTQSLVMTKKIANGVSKHIQEVEASLPINNLKIQKTAREEIVKASEKVVDDVLQKVDQISDTIRDLSTGMSNGVAVSAKAVKESLNGVAKQPEHVMQDTEEAISETLQEFTATSKVDAGSLLSDISKTVQGTFSSITGDEAAPEQVTLTEEPSEPSTTPALESQESNDSKPRVIFRIESEDELASDAENELLHRSELSSSTEEFAEKVKKDLKTTLEKEQMIIDEKLSTKAGIFDISDETISKTKELVDERLRKISEIKPPKEIEEPKKTEEIKIGRFHITPALVEEVVNRSKEKEIVEKLKTTRGEDEIQEEVEKELPEKLTEADLEEVIRELQLEGLKTDVYLEPEEKIKEEKKERTLKRVERRFERMASETLEKEKEEADSVSEDNLDEKREVEFQRMVSNLSSEEVAEYQQEYLQLWEDGGLSSLTPTEDWESRDPDTPENELEEDTPRKSESLRGSHGSGKSGEPAKATEPKTSVKSPTSPPKPPRLSEDVSPSAPPLTPTRLGSSPSEIDQTSGFVSDDIPTYGERKKFWEQMSSSQSSDIGSELPRSMHESVSSVESFDGFKTDPNEKKKEEEIVSVKTTKPKAEEGGIVKSLTESYSKKIAAGELVMPAIPRPKSVTSKDSSESETDSVVKPVEKLADSPGTGIVSELEIKLKSRSPSVPITEEAVISGSTELEEQSTKNVEFTIGSSLITKTKTEISREQSTDSEAEFLAKYGVESVAFDNTVFTEEDVAVPISERKRVFEDVIAKQPPRSSIHERSMSLPAQEIAGSIKMKKKFFEEEMKKEMIVEHIMSQEDEEKPEESIKDKIPKTLPLKETHLEKSETEENEKETQKKKKEEQVPSITITATAKKQTETASIGESEDTQSESDITPEDARVVDNGDAHWDGSASQSGGVSPKDDLDYNKEPREVAIGRWIGQEDLSKQIWEKEDLDSSHFKIHTKWERTRSEGASPKEPYVYTPEEHYPDTVWEVPVQEQLEKEEMTHDIPIEKQVIIEKDEEEDDEFDEGKVKLSEEEAKEIAEEILEYIQFEVENRSSFLLSEGYEEKPQNQVTEYLRHLDKDLDDQDVQMIESALIMKQRELINTTASSMDITDEELRTSEVDTSPVESQITKLEEEDLVQKLEKVQDEEIIDDAQKEIVDQTIAEVKESLEAAQEQLIEQHKKRKKTDVFKKESPSEFVFKGISYERTITEAIKEQIGEKIGEYESETQRLEEKTEDFENLEKKFTKDFLDEERKLAGTIDSIETEIRDKITKSSEISLDSQEARKVSSKDSTTESETTVTVKTERDRVQSSTSEILKVEETAKKMGDYRHSSEESPRSASIEDTKSPPTMGDEMHSSTSSFDKQEKSDIVFRHSSSSSTLLKADRRSGTDQEPYSSSGESHYHSFEQTSSRPCSSDVEVLMAGQVGTAGSSEYETALDSSSKQATSTDYHTAVSSLSSRESIKSLDSESSGHLASVEVSSEASETLIPSALELDKDLDTPGVLLEEDALDLMQKMVTRSAVQVPVTSTGKLEEDFEVISESEVASWAGEASEEDETIPVTGEEVDEENLQKMKRSQEMTFQPEPKPIVFSESLEKIVTGASVDETSSLISALDEKFGSSLEESGSVLSMSLSTTSEPSAMKTVIELSRTDSEKLDGSLTMSATSIDSREDVETLAAPTTNEMSTSTIISSADKKNASVTITTSTCAEHGIPSVSTQVTSVSRKSSMVDEAKSESDSSASTQPHANGPTQVEYVADYDEIESTKTKKAQGHRRKESTSNFVPNMMWNLSEARTQKIKTDFVESEEYESDKYAYDAALTEKEVKNDEKKEADDLESYGHSLETKISEEDIEDFDSNRPQSQISRTDSESGRRPVSSIFSEDQADSELSELMKQGSSETEKEDPLERPPSPEPEDMENKDITPEFSSEAQASVTELEMEYSGAYSRRDEYAPHVSPTIEEKSEILYQSIISNDRIEEEGIADGLRSQTSLESTVAEKHELESGEKEILKSKTEGDIPDITVTQHMTPVSSQKFQYPDTKEEVREKKNAAKTPDTPSSRTSSTSTDQGREYNLDEVEIKKFPRETLSEEKEVNETKDDKESADSPSSDSFEMLDKPDITDEFVIIEEVGREAQENDQEGRSVQITSTRKKVTKRPQTDPEVILSPPAPATKMTDLKYFPSEEDPDLFSFDSESPPQPTTRRFAEKLKRKSSKEEKEDLEYEQQIEQSKKWVEMQFQGEQAAKVVGAYGYEMEYERAPLEDIKEEDLNELDSSSKIGSMGSQKESLGSFGSVKDSFSSTPDYDVLAGKKYFTRSGDHDDVSMSSLQEFELIEKKLMENGKKSGSSSSQDSLSSKKLGTSSKSGQGDDASIASLREFENLENACATVVTMETKAKQEEAILSEIDEGHESQISESESCETVSAVIREKLESETEDFDKRMFEIDEIIRQAQSNVEKFSEMQHLEKIESMGRGDSYEEVAKVPDLELDMPLKTHSKTYSTQVVTKKKVQEWRAAEGMKDQPPKTGTKPKHSELLENGGKTKSISADSLEIQAKEKQLMLEGKDDSISLDSYKPKKSDVFGFPEITHKSDSMEEVSTSLRHYETSSGDYSSSGREDSGDHTYRPPPRAEFMLGSTDSLDPSSSTATHATYQYETDSVMSSSFTSGGSNTMVSSTDNIDLLMSGQSVINLGASKSDDWLESIQVGDRLLKKTSSSQKLHIAPEIQRIAFRGPDAEKALQEYLASLGPEEEVVETEETDEHGNVHVRKVLTQRTVIRPSEQKKDNVEIHREKLDIGSRPPFETETIEPLQSEDFSHIVHKKVQSVPEVEKITFKGPDAEKALKEYLETLNTGEEIEETEEVDEHGNIHIRRVVRQRVIVEPNKPQEQILKAAAMEKESKTQPETRAQKITTQITPNVERVTFCGPNAEEALRDYLKSLKPDEEVIETKEVDEEGNIHIKKVLRQRVVTQPGRMLSHEELQQYLDQLEEPESEAVKLPSEFQKVTFRGPDAEKQLQEFLSKQQKEEIEEVEEVDEDGNVHVKRIIKQRVFMRPEELAKMGAASTKVEKVSFTGPDAQEKLKEYLEGLNPEEVVEEQEVDEAGNIHIKKVLRQRIVAKPSRMLTHEELQQYLDQLEEPENEEVVEGGVQLPSQFQKVTFKGPDAEKQLQEFLSKQQKEEIDEIEEVDEDGNVHVKRIIKQRVFIRPEELPQPETSIQKVQFQGPDAEQALQAYMETLGTQGEISEIEEVDDHGNIHIKKVLRSKVIIRPDELNDKLTKEDLKEYLKARQTTLHFEKVDIGTTEPFVSEIIEPLDEAEYSHIIHQKVQMAPEVQKVVFRGPDADRALKAYVEALEPGEDFEETEEVDEEGNVHVKRVMRRKIVMRPEDLERTGLTGDELQSYLKQFERDTFEGEGSTQAYSFDPHSSTNQTLTEAFSSSVTLTEKNGQMTEERGESGSSSAIKKESGVSQRPPLVSDISMDDEAEYDTTEHDWRHQLEILHAEADEEEIDQNLDAFLTSSLEKKN